MADTRIAYGAYCTWWDSIDNVGIRRTDSLTVIAPSGHRTEVTGIALPCCPKCQGMLLEVPNLDTFLTAAENWQSNGHPGYVEYVKWLRGKCYPSQDAAFTAYTLAQAARN